MAQWWCYMLLKVEYRGTVWAKRIDFTPCAEAEVLYKTKEAVRDLIPNLRRCALKDLQISYHDDELAAKVNICDGATFTEIYRRAVVEVDTVKLRAQVVGKGLDTWVYSYDLPLHVAVVREAASNSAEAYATSADAGYATSMQVDSADVEPHFSKEEQQQDGSETGSASSFEVVNSA
ncbi:hypothetical protein JKP88DRAFT_272214 [Tribonema minus]|uniref:Uncharacterized protein n=1 Tax=Tribonema minus TaxID=303371 RepID=A0A835ZEC0_9STRA|nr:hypothetical protein JKP88DRAFT_272214 [Tribonema minus]